MIPYDLFLNFFTQALQKAKENKEIVICARVGIDYEKSTYVITDFTETNTMRESNIGVTYFCSKKDAVIHTHLFGAPIPSGVDIENMKKDNMILKIGRIIRPPNPVFYLIGSIYLQKSELYFKLAGYSINFRIEGGEINNKYAEVNISQNAYNYLNKINKIEYGVVYFTRQEPREDKIIIERIQTMEEYFKDNYQIPAGMEIGYFVTGISGDLVEPQDYILIYYVLELLNRNRATIFKFGGGLNVFEVSRTSNGVNLIYDNISNAEVLIDG